MDTNEYVEFLKGILIKIENAINLLGQNPPKHIPSYHKMLGVQQKLAGLDKTHKNRLLPQIINVRGIINYLMSGRYYEAHQRVVKLKIDMTKIYSGTLKKNENNKI